MGRRAWGIGLRVACALLFLLYAVLVLTKPISQDEGVFLAIGKYITQGQTLYLDVFDHKPPAIHFLFAGLFKLFGPSVWVAKAALIVSTLGAAILLKKIGDSLKPGIGWYATGIFLFLLTQFEGYYLIAEPFMLLPLSLALWILLRPNYSLPWLLSAGVCLGLALLFKQTALISLLPILWLASKRSTIQLLPVFIGLITPLLLTALYLLTNDALKQAWHQVVVLTLTEYPREAIPFILGSLQQPFLWTLPIWGLVLLAWWPYLKHKNLIWALVLLPLPLMFFRHYPHYWIQVLPFVAILAASVLADIRVRTVTVATVVFCLAIAGGKVGQDAQTNYQKQQAQIDVAETLRQESATYLLAENQFTAFYFLLPERPLNKYLYLTEITDAENAEEKTIQDLQRNQNVLILWPSHDRAYAKEVERFVEENATATKFFPALGMRLIKK